MSIFHRHGKCLGIPIFAAGKFYAEVWFCSKNYSIEGHYHEKQDNWIVYLFGNVTFLKAIKRINYIEVRDIKLSFRNFLKIFKIERNCSHAFINKNLPLIFINVARFIDNCKPVSASEDFKLTII